MIKERERRIVQVYWTKGMGIHYRNGNKILGNEETIERLSKREYDAVEIGWEGVMPVNYLFIMQRRKSEMEKIIRDSN